MNKDKIKNTIFNYQLNVFMIATFFITDVTAVTDNKHWGELLHRAACWSYIYHSRDRQKIQTAHLLIHLLICDI